MSESPGPLLTLSGATTQERARLAALAWTADLMNVITSQLRDKNDEAEAWLGEALERGDDFWPMAPEFPEGNTSTRRLLEGNTQVLEMASRATGYYQECAAKGSDYIALRIRANDERLLVEVLLRCAAVKWTEERRRFAHIKATWRPGNPAFELQLIRDLEEFGLTYKKTEETLLGSLKRLGAHPRFGYSVHYKRYKGMGHLFRQAELARAVEMKTRRDEVIERAKLAALYEAVRLAEAGPPAEALPEIRTKKSEGYTKDLLGADYYHYLNPSQTAPAYVASALISGSGSGLEEGPPDADSEDHGKRPWSADDWSAYRNLVEECRGALARDFVRKVEDRIEMEQVSAIANLTGRDVTLMLAAQVGMLPEAAAHFGISYGRARNLSSIATSSFHVTNKRLWEDLGHRLASGPQMGADHSRPLAPARWCRQSEGSTDLA